MGALFFRVACLGIASDFIVIADLNFGLVRTAAKNYRPVDNPVDIDVDNIWG